MDWTVVGCLMRLPSRFHAIKSECTIKTSSMHFTMMEHKCDDDDTLGEMATHFSTDLMCDFPASRLKQVSLTLLDKSEDDSTLVISINGKCYRQIHIMHDNLADLLLSGRSLGSGSGSVSQYKAFCIHPPNGAFIKTENCERCKKTTNDNDSFIIMMIEENRDLNLRLCATASNVHQKSNEKKQHFSRSHI